MSLDELEPNTMLLSLNLNTYHLPSLNFFQTVSEFLRFSWFFTGVVNCKRTLFRMTSTSSTYTQHDPSAKPHNKMKKFSWKQGKSKRKFPFPFLPPVFPFKIEISFLSVYPRFAPLALPCTRT